jgi:hypothetical protein
MYEVTDIVNGILGGVGGDELTRKETGTEDIVIAPRIKIW